VHCWVGFCPKIKFYLICFYIRILSYLYIFRLFTFPTKLNATTKEKRLKWKYLSIVLRKTRKSFGHQRKSRVWSNHFVDMKPTERNPYPTILLGYDAERKVKNVVGSSRRKLCYAKPPPQPIDKVEADVSSEVPDKESKVHPTKLKKI